MAWRAVTAKGVAIAAIVAVLTSASLLLRLPRRSAGPPPVLAARALPAVLVSLSELPPREWIALETPEELLKPAEKTLLIPSRTLTIANATRAQDGGGATFSVTRSSVADDEPLIASRPIAVVLEDVSVDEQQTSESPRQGVITKAMGTTSRVFRVAGTSVASAFRKVF